LDTDDNLMRSLDELNASAAALRSLTTELADGSCIECLQAGAADQPVSQVLLHGIGSAAASWLEQLEAANRLAGEHGHRLLAWNAPGYGESTRLAPECPVAADYANRLWHWLDALGVQHPVTVVGQSMGCLIAAAAARAQPARVARLVLFAPARGYGRADPTERERRRSERLDALRQQGPAGLAERRAPAMLSPAANADLIGYVRSLMARVSPAGYAQATEMLAQGDIDGDLATWRGPLVVASGEADRITPPDSCRDIAARAGVSWTNLGAVGHGCPLEAPQRANEILGLVPR
jgi:pimeloyl-ACP methyl ester carboxylesterase